MVREKRGVTPPPKEGFYIAVGRAQRTNAEGHLLCPAASRQEGRRLGTPSFRSSVDDKDYYVKSRN